MKFKTKPYLFNNRDMKEFDSGLEAVLYLNQQLSDIDVDEKLDYVFVAPKASPSELKFAIDEYVGIGKIIIEE